MRLSFFLWSFNQFWLVQVKEKYILSLVNVSWHTQLYQAWHTWQPPHTRPHTCVLFEFTAAPCVCVYVCVCVCVYTWNLEWLNSNCKSFLCGPSKLWKHVACSVISKTVRSSLSGNKFTRANSKSALTSWSQCWLHSPVSRIPPPPPQKKILMS